MNSFAETAKNTVAAGASLLLGRRNLVRLGRFLSNRGRLDLTNEIDSNGERLIQDLVLRRAAAGGTVTVFDVGANVGLWTQQLLSDSAKHALVKVHLFEPARVTFQTLVSNISQWTLQGSTTLNNSALSSRDACATLYSRGINAGTNSLYQIGTGVTTVPTEEISLETCSTYCKRKGIEHLDLLKIDTEGHDMEVIEGARGMLEYGQIDALQFEYTWRWIDARHFLKDAFALLVPLGYAIGKVTPRGVEFYDEWHFELETFREANFVAVKKELCEQLPQVRWWNQA